MDRMQWWLYQYVLSLRYRYQEVPSVASSEVAVGFAQLLYDIRSSRA